MNDADLATPPSLPVPRSGDETRVRRGFWRKLARVAGRVPFAEEAATGWFCAVDPETPARVKAALIAALAYFVTPTDLVPDFIAGLGFTDDASVVMATLGLVAAYVKPRHRERARMALGAAGEKASGG